MLQPPSAAAAANPPPVTTTTTPGTPGGPVRFRIHAQATYNSRPVSPAVVTDVNFEAGASSSYCNLLRAKLTVPVAAANCDVDDVVVRLSCVPVLAGEESKQPAAITAAAALPSAAPEHTFASVNVVLGHYRSPPPAGGGKTNASPKKYAKAPPETTISTHGRIKFGHDERTRNIKLQAAKIGSTLMEKQLARWRTGNIAFRIRALGLPKSKAKTTGRFMGGGQSSVVQPTSPSSSMASAAGAAGGTVNVVFTLKSLMRTQHDSTSDELAKINIESDLKRMQKDRQNLTIVVLVVLLFLIVGGVFYPLVEGWTVLDSLYFGVTTLTTVGYGDMGPTTDGSKIFTAFYVFFGVAIVATLIGLATTFLIEAAALAAEVEKKKKREALMNDASDSDTDSEDEEDEGEEDGGGGGNRDGGNNSVALPIDERTTASAGKPTCLARCFTRSKFFFREFLPAIVCCTVGIIVMMVGQGSSFVDAFYWSIVTGTTVGYGDVSPLEPVTRGFSLVYLFASVVCMAKALSAFGSLLEADDGHAASLLNRKLDEKFLVSLDSDGTGEVSEFEYLSAMLVLLEYVEQDDIDDVMKAFRKLDTDGSGTLTVDDLVQSRKGKAVMRTPRKVFKDCDVNGNGSLEPAEVANALRALGCRMTDAEFDALFLTVDTNHDGAVSFREFKRVLYSRIVYEAIDDDVDGHLEREEIRESIPILLKVSVSDAEFDTLFNELDADRNGNVSFAEYRRFFQDPKAVKRRIEEARNKPASAAAAARTVSNYSVEKGASVSNSNSA